MTATELADRLDESPANCSWHLRKLAEHDFIEEAPGGSGRQRPWQMRHIGMSLGRGRRRRPGGAACRPRAEPDAPRALGRPLPQLAERARGRAASGATAAELTQNVAWLTPEELADVTARLQEVAGTYADRLATGERPEGSRLCEIVAWGAPVEVAR